MYIGTSGSEILHFVSIQLDNDSENDEPTFIRASRLSPRGHNNRVVSPQQPGVSQILILPSTSKACVLCNGTVSFYTLPELSPAFPNKEPTGVQWIGGVEEDEAEKNPDGPLVMIANSRRVLLVRVGEKLRPLKTNIEYPGCLRSSRRGSIACIADASSYALIDIEHQQKIPLFAIRSTTLIDSEISASVGDSPAPQSSGGNLSPSRPDSSNHGRSTSLGSFLTPNRQASPSSHGQDDGNVRSPNPDNRNTSPGDAGDQSTQSSLRPRSSTEADKPSSISNITLKQLSTLNPNIASPTNTEFLLTTGTAENEPGVGMFVNLDGDVVRGSIEFAAYPLDLIIESSSTQVESSAFQNPDSEDEKIYALMRRPSSDEYELGIEIQSLQPNTTTLSAAKTWLPVPSHTKTPNVMAGLRHSLSPLESNFSEVGEILRLVRFRGTIRTPPDAQSSLVSDPRTRVAVERVEEEKALFETQQDDLSSLSFENEKQRTAEEHKFARAHGFVRSQTFFWSGNQLWQILKVPMVKQLESDLEARLEVGPDDQRTGKCDVKTILALLASINGWEPRTETQFIGLKYIRQKASLMLLVDLWRRINMEDDLEHLPQALETALIEGGIDPRIVLVMLPEVQRDVRQGTQGIWVHQGLSQLLKTQSLTWSKMSDAPIEFWMLLRRYLSSWQEKRGYASITDEELVFDSVDAALLRILLYLDQSLPRGGGLQLSTRAKLNNVVDHWKGDFGNAVVLLEEYNRLFVLSRLYQSRKMAKNVLETWRRIGNGEHDSGGEMTPAAIEFQMRQYLVNIRNTALVEEYSMWLAQRNKDLAIQLLTDDACRVKLTPSNIVAMLKSKAPEAVQQYLEHLVFKKHMDQYADDLIGYYLDSVLSVLESSEEARNSLSESYSTYRALEKPKPTYLNFIHENAPPQLWWQSRLRLLQLLGTGSYAPTSSSKELTYSIPKVLDRLTPFSEYLVSESIILDARQGRHKEALRLLTHGLGDYDTAVRYCYFGGPIGSTLGAIDESILPSREKQKDLFEHLLGEFLMIEDATESLERTSELLGKFAAWFDPIAVFSRVPDLWTVDQISEFLQRSFRALTSEHNEAVILRALSAAQNLQKQVAFVEACEKFGMKMENQNESVGTQ